MALCGNTSDGRVVWIAGDDPQFGRIKDLIRRKYFDVYGATAPLYAKEFLVYRSAGDADETACVSVTPLAPARVFAEQYLTEPADCVLARKERHPITRAEIVELGTFAASSPAAAVELLDRLPPTLTQRGFRYGLLTAVPDIQLLLSEMDLPFHPLAPARAEALPAGDVARWGTYYDKKPVTGYIKLRDSGASAPAPAIRSAGVPALSAHLRLQGAT